MSDEKPEADTRSGEAPHAEQIEYHYLKSNFFRVVHADGAFGGITPRGYIHFSLFNERGPIPKKTVREIRADGTLLPQTIKKSKSGVVREIEIDVVLDKDAAVHLHSWLGRKIIELMEKEKEAGED